MKARHQGYAAVRGCLQSPTDAEFSEVQEQYGKLDEDDGDWVRNAVTRHKLGPMINLSRLFLFLGICPGDGLTAGIWPNLLQLAADVWGKCVDSMVGS